MKKIKIPGVGFIIGVVALLCAIVGFILFFSTYNVAGYKLNRWTVTCTALAIWFLLCACVSMFFEKEGSRVRDVFLILAVFCLTYGVLKFIHPCLTPIGFAFAASDLNMGDSALNRVIAVRAVITAVFYVLAIIATIVTCFLAKNEEEQA